MQTAQRIAFVLPGESPLLERGFDKMKNNQINICWFR